GAIPHRRRSVFDPKMQEDPAGRWIRPWQSSVLGPERLYHLGLVRGQRDLVFAAGGGAVGGLRVAGAERKQVAHATVGVPDGIGGADGRDHVHRRWDGDPAAAPDARGTEAGGPV